MAVKEADAHSDFSIIRTVFGKPLEKVSYRPKKSRRKGKRHGYYNGVPGAKARAESLTPERRKEIASAAAKKRWAEKRA